MLKLNADFVFPFISKVFSESTEMSIDDLKLTNITPVYKKNNRNKVNWRSVSIVPGLPKIFEKCLYDQICKNVGSIFSKHETGYWKGYSS